MKRLLLIVCVLCLTLSLCGCVTLSYDGSGSWNLDSRKIIQATGDAKTVSYDFGDAFDGVEVSVSGRYVYLTLMQGECAVSIDADSAFHDDLSVEERGGRLILDSANDLDGRVDIKVTVPELKLLALHGAAVGDSYDRLSGESIVIELSGASEVTLDLDYVSINATLSGASEGKLYGTCDEMHVGLSGASTIDAEKLLAKSVSIDASGASEAMVYAGETVSVSASGASEIRYAGDGELTRSSLSGGSSVQKMK